jgi:hypothetical protein
LKALSNAIMPLPSNVFKHVVWLVPLLLLTTWLGARGLNADAIWYDEYRSLFYAGGSHYGPIAVSEVWTRVALYGGSAQVPGYFTLLWGWGGLVGWTEFAARSLSLFFGLLAMAWTYRLGAAMLSPRGGLYATAILGISAFFIHYLHELRVYTLLALMTALTVWVYQRIVTSKQEPGRGLQLALLASVAASLYSHYLSSLTLVAIGLYHLIFVRKNARWLRVVVLMGIGGVLFLPWASVLVSGVDSKTRETAANSLEVLNNIAHSLGNDNLILLMVVLLSAVFVWRRARLAWFLLLGVLALGLLLNRWLRVGDTRYYMALWPLFAVVASAGILRFTPPPDPLPIAIGRGRKESLVLVLWMVVGVAMVFRPEFIGDYAGVNLIASIFPWQVAAQEINPYAQSGDLVTFAMPESVVANQQWEIATHYLHDVEARYDMGHTILASDVGNRFGMEEIAESPLRVWTAYMHPKPALLTEFEAVLNDRYIPCGTIISGAIVSLDLYASCQACCPPEDAERDALYRFGDRIIISGMESLPEEVSESLDVRLGWVVPDDVPRYTYSVALHVVDSEGNLAAQADYGLPEQRFSCALATVALGDLMPGEYRLMAVVYAWETGERLQGVAIATGEMGDRVTLGTFRVAE